MLTLKNIKKVLLASNLHYLIKRKSLKIYEMLKKFELVIKKSKFANNFQFNFVKKYFNKMSLSTKLRMFSNYIFTLSIKLK